MNKELFQETSTAVSSPIENDYTWEVNPDAPETVMITSFKGQVQRKTAPDGSLLSVASINIPYMLDNKIVTIIGQGAFQGNTTFDRVVFHSDILSIETGAFANCSELRYIAFNSDSQLQYIKADAFINTNINSPIIPASVNRIESGAFDTYMLKTVTFLGDCPIMTVDSFNSQNDNGNLSQKITISYFINAIGFDNNISDSKFLYISNYRMTLPRDVTSDSASTTTSFMRVVFYILLGILLIVFVYFIYVRFIKKQSAAVEGTEDIAALGNVADAK
uniref:Uncharacterized protein n=1 Tax=viral metagenome TaxID=1070528 RepID=A0A6C0HXT5_9ZZZZ